MVSSVKRLVETLPSSEAYFLIAMQISRRSLKPVVTEYFKALTIRTGSSTKDWSSGMMLVILRLRKSAIALLKSSSCPLTGL